MSLEKIAIESGFAGYIGISLRKSNGQSARRYYTFYKAFYMDSTTYTTEVYCHLFLFHEQGGTSQTMQNKSAESSLLSTQTPSPTPHPGKDVYDAPSPSRQHPEYTVQSSSGPTKNQGTYRFHDDVLPPPFHYATKLSVSLPRGADTGGYVYLFYLLRHSHGADNTRHTHGNMGATRPLPLAPGGIYSCTENV